MPHIFKKGWPSRIVSLFQIILIYSLSLLIFVIIIRVVPLFMHCLIRVATMKDICEQIWEKGPLCAFSENPFLIAHNFWTVIAMSFRLGANILQSLVNTCCKFRAPPTSGMGMATAQLDRVRNRPFYASLQAFSALDRSLARLSNVRFV